MSGNLLSPVSGAASSKKTAPLVTRFYLIRPEQMVVVSRSDPHKAYAISLSSLTCECPGYVNRGKCYHLEDALAIYKAASEGPLTQELWDRLRVLNLDLANDFMEHYALLKRKIEREK